MRNKIPWKQCDCQYRLTVVGERKSGLQCGKCGGTGFVKPDDVSLYEHILALNEYFECNIFGV